LLPLPLLLLLLSLLLLRDDFAAEAANERAAWRSKHRNPLGSNKSSWLRAERRPAPRASAPGLPDQFKFEPTVEVEEAETEEATASVAE